MVDPSATWIATQTPESTGTLYACHPPGSLAQRYVVRLALCPPDEPGMEGDGRNLPVARPPRCP